MTTDDYTLTPAEQRLWDAEAAEHWHVFADHSHLGARAFPEMMDEAEAHALADDLVGDDMIDAVWIFDCPADQGCMFYGTADPFDPAEAEAYWVRPR